jgi:hypothetical protein
MKQAEIFNLNGRNIGFINNNAVYDINASYKGTFTNGFFRDRYGCAVTFIHAASNGPLSPLPQLPPIPPIPNIPNIHPIPSIPPIPNVPSLSWSNIDWNDFLNI